MKTSEKVLNWAKNKDLLKPENVKTQHSKLIEECGELGEEIRLLTNFRQIQEALHDELGLDEFQFMRYVESVLVNKARLELGDNLVVLEILANQLETTAKKCKKLAYNKIKNRKGETIEGKFIKDAK